MDHRADLYAVGVVGYEMLAGRAPFEGRSPQQLMAAHATQSPEPIARFRTSVPAALGGLVMQLLEKNPADRPQSADELRRRLDGLPDEVIAPAQATVPTGPPCGGAGRFPGRLSWRWALHWSVLPPARCSPGLAASGRRPGPSSRR